MLHRELLGHADRRTLAVLRDAVQISTLVAQLGPRLCYLVHGDESAREALAPMVGATTKTLLPMNGEVAEFSFASCLRNATARPQRAVPIELPMARRKPRQEKRGHNILHQARKAVALIQEVRNVGWRPETQELLLYVAFPKAFEQRRATFLSELSQRLRATLVVLGKKDEPDEYIEVGLLAPWFLEGHEELVQQLEKETGYPVRASGANIQALEKRARELLPPAWQVLKPFQWFGREARLVLGRRRFEPS